MAALARFRPVLLLKLVAEHPARAGNRVDEAWEILPPLGYAASKLSAGEVPVDAFAGDADYLLLPGSA